MGIGREEYKITFVEQEFVNYKHKYEEEHLKGIEIFQVINAGCNATLWGNFILSGEVRYSWNVTNNTITTTNFNSYQFLIGLGYKFSI